MAETPNDPEGLTQEPEAPAADLCKPPPAFSAEHTAKGVEASRRAAKVLSERQVDRVRRVIEDAMTDDDLTDHRWVLRTLRRCMKAAGLSEQATLNLIRRRMKIVGGLTALRLARLKERDGKGPEGSGELPPSPLLKWNILDLFDRLLQHFEVVEDDDDAEEHAEDPGDKRRTWIAWRVLLAAAFGVAQKELAYDHSKDASDPEYLMPEYPGVEDIDTPRGAAAVPKASTAQQIFELCTGRMTWPKVQAKLVNLIVGRRGGKSYITAIIGIYLACCRKHKVNLGTKGMVMILARDKQQAGVIRAYIIAFLKALDELRIELADQPTQTMIELKNGITIEVRAAGGEGTRGYTVVAVLADEIAFWPTDDESAKQDKKVLRALRPAMLGVRNPMTVLLSSPYAQRGELYENHRKSFGQDEHTKRLVWQADTLTMRPSDDPDLLEEIADEYEEDPENAKAEYGALFRSDIENLYSRMAVESVSVLGRFEQGYNDRFDYRAFVDPSGGSSDSYVLAIAHDEVHNIEGEERTIAVLDKVVEWVPKFDPEEVSKEVVRHCQSFHINSVTGDAYGGEWPRDPLKKRGINYELSEMSRSELYLAFVSLVNSKTTELLDPDRHKKAVNQFANLERRVGRTGKDSVDHPPGSHDDVANAIAGVLVSASGNGDDCTW
jgi:hypothetical protein